MPGKLCIENEWNRISINLHTDLGRDTVGYFVDIAAAVVVGVDNIDIVGTVAAAVDNHSKTFLFNS